MRIPELSARRVVLAIVAIVAVMVVVLIMGLQPVTRAYVATNAVCSYCHLEREYDFTAKLPFTSPHPAEPKDGQQAAQCADCHLPKGVVASAFMYTHILSATDLFGHFRDRAAERAGDWIPGSAARAYRVRARLFEFDSVTCRSCHIEAEIKPTRIRGQNAHKSALENNDTCIECHDNLVHRYIEVGDNEFRKPDDE